MKKTMWKRAAALAAAAVMALSLAACGSSAPKEAESSSQAASSAAQSEAQSETAQSEAEASSAAAESAAGSGASAANKAADDGAYASTTVRIGSLKGPTTMGLVNMMQKGEDGALPFGTEFTMAAAPDEITAKVVKGELDIALIPANLASVLYNKTEGGVQVLNVNTLGVLYGVTGDETVKSLADLAGKTVYMTGQGATPEYAFRYILAQNGLSDKVTLEFKSEATEIAALLKEDPSKIAVLPQPFATVCQMQNEQVKEFMNLTEEWAKCPDSGNSQLLTGVTIVSTEFAKAHATDGLLDAFLAEQESSAKAAEENLDQTAELVAKYGIIEKAPVAKKALPKCGIVCISGTEMKDALSGYLDVLYQADAKSVGGKLAGEDFYLALQEKAE